MVPAPKVLVGWQLKLLDFADVQAWAADRLSHKKDPTGELADILRGKEDRTEAILKAIVAIEASDFEVGGSTSHGYAKDLWLARLQSFLAGTKPPWTICQSVSLIEQAYDFPEWLGDMYNACDWVQKDWPRRNAPQVEEEAQEIIDRYLA